MGKKKSAALHGASKKERAKLEARAAELAAEIERRAKKKAKKAKASKAEKPSKKKGKTPKPAEIVEPMVITAVAEAHVAGDLTPEEIAAASAPVEPESDTSVDRDRSKPLSGKALKKALEADVAAGKARMAKAAADAETDAEIKARVQAKRAAREAGAVDVKAARMPDALDGETEVDYQMRKLREKKAAPKGKSSNVDKGGLVAAAEAHALAATTEAVEAIKSAVEIVETEHGREFAVGESVAADAPEEFAKPSDATPELEEGRNGYKIIQLDADGKPDPRKVRQLTRVTTFVKNIDDETNLKLWEKRLLAEGISAHADEFAPRVNDIVHRREVAIAKGRKADRKGKLDIGELAIIEETANKAAKDALNALVEEALEAAGRNDKADAGTNLHTLAELSDAEGIDAVRAKYEAGEISPTDLASIEAYAARMARLGAKVIESEAVIVNDAMGYAGRLDRIIMARLPEITITTAAGSFVRPADKRSRRYVADIKSGRIDYGAGQISRQLAAYALGDLYDLETGERRRHSAATDVALVFHLPQGAGVCTVHAVDIKSGAILLKLSAEVRRARNTGKKTIDTTVDIADPAEGDEADD